MNWQLATWASLSLAALAGASGTAAKPVAQVFTSADLERILPAHDHGCILGQAAKTATPEQKLANCSAGMAEFEALRRKARTPAELAGFDFMIGGYEFGRAGAFLGIDKVRSARVCDASERAFGIYAPIDATLFDSQLAEALNASRTAISRAVAVCRSEFGTPAGAPALVSS